MSDFNHLKMRRLDLTVLLIFAGLIRHGKASLVAQELGLTNSSISHALRRLREVFEDELFLRRPHGLEPTAFARSIEPAVQSALDALQSALVGPTAFDPGQSAAHIRLSAQDYEIATLVPALMARLHQSAPGITLSIQAHTKADALKALEAGDVDLALGFFPDRSSKHLSTVLFEESYLVTARADHPFLRDGPTLERYLAADHLLVSGDATMAGIVDQVLAAQGLKRRVVLSVPLFLPALAMLADSPMIATLPAALVRLHAARFQLSFTPPPITVRTFQVHALRHVRDEKNPMINWLVDELNGIRG
ncbi:LysR family transcriptional regulator [Ahrensia marina]|uniref:LysR family transcriptional regulator n=1 Tax=Ahrensia marina TaxID=1514904 RepID=UPI0035CFFDB5